VGRGRGREGLRLVGADGVALNVHAGLCGADDDVLGGARRSVRQGITVSTAGPAPEGMSHSVSMRPTAECEAGGGGGDPLRREQGTITAGGSALALALNDADAEGLRVELRVHR